MESIKRNLTGFLFSFLNVTIQIARKLGNQTVILFLDPENQCSGYLEVQLKLFIDIFFHCQWKHLRVF